MIDYHLHSSFSKDSKEEMQNICLAAREKGLKYIAITDHLDYDDAFKDSWEIKNIDGENGYLETVDKLRGNFPDINIALGVEAGYTLSGQKKIIEKINLIKPDFVIGSLHFIGGLDLYDSIFFEGKTKKQAYDFYFEKLYESIEPLSQYSNVIGHFTYISKSPNLPYENPQVEYKEHKKQIDDILKRIIDLGMGIEINTSGLFKKVSQLLPNFEIVKAYKDLGGEILTIGSDAHFAKDVGSGIETAFAAAMEAGFKYVTVFPFGKETRIKIL